MTKPSDGSSILASLESHLPSVLAEQEAEERLATQVAAPQKPEVMTEDEKDIKDDYEFSRKSYRHLVETSNEAIRSMLDLALECENPRAYEVLSAMLKNTGDITDKLMDLQIKKKEASPVRTPSSVPSAAGILGALPPGGTTNVFVGTTAELQKALIEHQKAAKEKNITPPEHATSKEDDPAGK